MSDSFKILELVKRDWIRRKNDWQYEFELPAPIYANDISNDLYAKDIAMNCNHEWLVPSDKRTRCKRCGDDGWVSYDGKVHESYEACMNHDALSYGASPLSLPQKLELKSTSEDIVKVSEKHRKVSLFTNANNTQSGYAKTQSGHSETQSGSCIADVYTEQESPSMSDFDEDGWLVLGKERAQTSVDSGMGDMAAYMYGFMHGAREHREYVEANGPKVNQLTTESESINCPICGSKTDKVEITFDGIETFTRRCSSQDCDHEYLPAKEEHRLDHALLMKAEERIRELETELEERRVATPKMEALNFMSRKISELEAENERCREIAERDGKDYSDLSAKLILATDALEQIYADADDWHLRGLARKPLEKLRGEK